jgi:hypothetical protein
MVAPPRGGALGSPIFHPAPTDPNDLTNGSELALTVR